MPRLSRRVSLRHVVCWQRCKLHVTFMIDEYHDTHCRAAFPSSPGLHRTLPTRSSSAAASAGWRPRSGWARGATASPCWSSSMRPAAGPTSTGRTGSPSTPGRPSSPPRSCSRSSGELCGRGWPTTSSCGRCRPFYRIRFHDGDGLRLHRRPGRDAGGGRPVLARRRRGLRALHEGERGDLPGRLRAARPRARSAPGPTWRGSLPDLVRLAELPHASTAWSRSYVRDPRLRTC